MRKYLVAYILLCFALFAGGQEFISPVQHEIKLAGTFGELRSNHFHMGIDIKSSNRSTGDPILAAASGFISRIKVSRSGYGNALYIDHPEGFTSVYGHLRNFSKSIDSLVTSYQEQEKNFEIDVEFDEAIYPIQQGEEIGNMGNSGTSYGPHLHFEIRDTKTEAPLNPMRFGISPVDDTAPIIKNVRIYALDDKYHEIEAKSISPASVSPNQYRLPKQKIGAWRIGVGIQTYDPMNAGYNKNGVYQIELLEDGVRKYSCSFDSISFEDSRYINAHIDYRYYKDKKARFHRCFLLHGNQLPIYGEQDAIIKLFEQQSKSIQVRVTDFQGNTSTVDFEVSRDQQVSKPKPKIFNYFLPYNEPHIVQLNDVELFVTEGSLYEDLYLYLSRSPSEYFSDVYHIGDEQVPLHKPLKIYLKNNTVPIHLREKACVVECTDLENISTYGGHWEGEYFISELFSFGNYTLTLDTIAPVITPINTQSKEMLQFRIEDNFSNSGRAKGLEYQASIDGKWAKFEYDLKTNKITHRLTSPPEQKNHILHLSVTDDRGNTSTLEKKFFR